MPRFINFLTRISVLTLLIPSPLFTLLHPVSAASTFDLVITSATYRGCFLNDYTGYNFIGFDGPCGYEHVIQPDYSSLPTEIPTAVTLLWDNSSPTAASIDFYKLASSINFRTAPDTGTVFATGVSSSAGSLAIDPILFDEMRGQNLGIRVVNPATNIPMLNQAWRIQVTYQTYTPPVITGVDSISLDLTSTAGRPCLNDYPDLDIVGFSGPCAVNHLIQPNYVGLPDSIPTDVIVRWDNAADANTGLYFGTTASAITFSGTVPTGNIFESINNGTGELHISPAKFNQLKASGGGITVESFSVAMNLENQSWSIEVVYPTVLPKFSVPLAAGVFRPCLGDYPGYHRIGYSGPCAFQQAVQPDYEMAPALNPIAVKLKWDDSFNENRLLNFFNTNTAIDFRNALTAGSNIVSGVDMRDGQIWLGLNVYQDLKNNNRGILITHDGVEFSMYSQAWEMELVYGSYSPPQLTGDLLVVPVTSGSGAPCLGTYPPEYDYIGSGGACGTIQLIQPNYTSLPEGTPLEVTLSWDNSGGDTVIYIYSSNIPIEFSGPMPQADMLLDSVSNQSSQGQLKINPQKFIQMKNLGVGLYVAGPFAGIPLDNQSWSLKALYPASNTPPTVDAGGPYSVNEGASVNVAAIGQDVQDSALSYSWDLDDNGSFETSGQTASFSAQTLRPGIRTIHAKAVDSGGLFVTDSATVNILDIPTYDDFSVLGMEGVWLKQGGTVTGGDVGVGNQATQFLDSGVELSVGIGVQITNVQSDLYADSIRLKSSSTVNDVFVNDFVNNGTILGSLSQPLSLPVVPSYPAMPDTTPGAQDVDVATATTINLAAGSYDQFIARNNSTITLTGGVYHFTEWDVRSDVTIYAAAPVEIRIAEKLNTTARFKLLPVVGSSLTATDIKIFVNGINGVTGNIGATPKSAAIGSDSVVQANFYVPRGTLNIREGSTITGSLIGKWVMVGENVVVNFLNGF